MHDSLEPRVERDGSRVRLLSPDVGLYTAELDAGALASAGACLGVLTQLGVRRRLVVPAGVEGRVTSAAPERTHHPVGWGDVLAEIEEVVAGVAGRAAPAVARAPQADVELAVRAATSGRFWHRSAPGEPALTAAGALVADGTPLGLLEVMKTFSHVVYRPHGGLPARARVVRVVAADGADVRRGDALVAIEAVS